MPMDCYKFNLNTYKYPPSETCRIHELERICEERLQLYRIMDSANLKYQPNTRKWEEFVEYKIIQNKLRTYITLLKNEACCVGITEARKHNHIGHWLLSLCYCRNNALKEFFMCCELYWFVMLYKRTKEEELREFLAQNKFRFIRVTKCEKELFKEKLIKCRNIKEINFNNICYYKTEFSEVANLVIIRQVFLYRGFAYFPETDIIFCVKSRLWRQFCEQLSWTNRMLPTGIKENRMRDFCSNIPIVMPTYGTFGEKRYRINLNDIDDIAKLHYPLCMKTIHDVLRKEHHLKYDCKMQYGIFLKCLGLSYEDAMVFWKTEFTKKMTEDRFDRKYAYLFKHQYGKVGGKLEYKPKSCDKILNNNPQPGQCHGCPFKHWDEDKLLQRCQDDGLRLVDINDIKNLVTNKKFKEACTIYFCGRHQVIRGEVINGPNEYFTNSCELETSLDQYFDTILENCESQLQV